jgi:hypothetical protein
VHRSVQAVVVAVLLAVNAALIAGAVHLHRKDDHSATVSPVVTTSLPTTEASISGDSIGPLNQDADKVRAATSYPAPLFSATSTVDAWRALPGCQTGPNLMEHDGKSNNWNRMLPPDSYILNIEMKAPNKGIVIAANATCTIPSLYRTTDRGNTWSKTSKLGHVWFGTPVGVRTPSGDVSTPCGRSSAMPIALATAGPDRAIVICRRGIFLTSDGGGNWRPTGQVTAGRAVDVTLTESGAGVLLMQDLDVCGGTISLLTSDFGTSWTPGQCLKVASPPLGLDIAEDGSGLLSALQSQYLTTDFGHTWR